VLCIAMLSNTQGDSDVISFHIYASWFSAPSCIGKTLRNVCYFAVTFIRFIGRLMITWTLSSAN